MSIAKLIKKLVLAWDSDFAKVTKAEIEEMDRAEAELKAGDYVSHDDIDWK